MFKVTNLPEDMKRSRSSIHFTNELEFTVRGTQHFHWSGAKFTHGSTARELSQPT
jgi:hypothetical protein